LRTREGKSCEVHLVSNLCSRERDWIGSVSEKGDVRRWDRPFAGGKTGESSSIVWQHPVRSARYDEFFVRRQQHNSDFGIVGRDESIFSSIIIPAGIQANP